MGPTCRRDFFFLPRTGKHHWSMIDAHDSIRAIATSNHSFWMRSIKSPLSSSISPKNLLSGAPRLHKKHRRVPLLSPARTPFMGELHCPRVFPLLHFFFCCLCALPWHVAALVCIPARAERPPPKATARGSYSGEQYSSTSASSSSSTLPPSLPHRAELTGNFLTPQNP
jgi:hypothetical protein